jgi:hypothetical protein
MANPDYASTGLPHSHLVDSWAKPKPYLDPTQSDMDGGNKRLRRQPGDEMQQIEFAIMYTDAQFNTFETWVRTFRGIGRFTMQVYDGSTVAARTVQFVEQYVPQAVPPGRKQVSFKLWIYP